MRQHPAIGAELLKGSSIPLLDMAAIISLTHHENFDGSGYPRGLVGEEIDLLSRMAAICDTYDVLVGDSAEGDGMNPSKSIDYLVERPSQFDPSIVRTFKEAMGVFPIGSVVRLRSDRLAMVVDQHGADHTRPKVRTFFSLALGERVHSEEIDLGNCKDEDEILGLADMSRFDPEEVRELRHRMMNAVMRAA